jgi:uncharacterized protein (DUF1810 family)
LKDRRGRQTSCRFYHQLRAAGEKLHRFDQLDVTHCDHVVNQLTDHRERVTSQVLSPRTVCNCLRDIDVDNPAGAEAALTVIARFGFDPDNGAFRIESTGRNGTSGEQAASAQRYHERIQRAGILKQFLGCRALARHWIWYVFPQLVGLGRSGTAQFYAIRNLDEACEYLHDSTLRAHYKEITAAVMEKLEQGITVESLMGGPTDALKLASSLTLFRAAASKLTDEASAALARLCDAVLRITATQGYPPCKPTLEQLRSV